MAEYYRSNFTVECYHKARDIQGLDLMNAIKEVVCDWARIRKDESTELNEDGSWTSEDGASFIIESEQLASSGYCRLVLIHPDDELQDTDWRCEFRLATIGNAVDAEVEVRRIFEDSESTNAHRSANRPRALVRLFQDFKCSSDSMQLSTQAENIAYSNSSDFVSEVLTNPARRLSIVAIVKNSQGGIFLDPDRLQSRLLGLGKVYTYDNETARQINRELSEWLGCWDGTVRVYRPGCTSDDASRQNIHWTWRRMSYIWARQGWDTLLTEIADECLLHSLPQTGQRLYDKVSLDVNQERSEKLLEMIKAATLDESTYQELLSDAASSIEALGRQNAELRQRRTELESENELLRSQVEQLNVALSYQDSEDSLSERESQDASPDFGSVHEAVNVAVDQLGGLRFFNLAIERARGSQFPRPSEVYGVFRSLDECAKARSQGSLGKDVQEWFADRGVDYSPHESPTTMGKYGDKRIFYDDVLRCRTSMPAHIKLGGGAGEHNQLRIHLEWREDENAWLIGYIGRHLPTASG